MVLHATNLLIHRRLVDDVMRYRDAAELIVLPPPCPVRVQPMDFSQAESLIEQALVQGRRFLDRAGDEQLVAIDGIDTVASPSRRSGGRVPTVAR
jgi:NTE family protein